MDSPIKTEALKIGLHLPQTSELPPLKSQRVVGYFLRGPIPLSWLAKAAHLPGKAFHAAILIRLQQGIEGDERLFKVDMKFRALFGISRFAWCRALVLLKRDGLIEFIGKRGKCARIKVIELPPNPQEVET